MLETSDQKRGFLNMPKLPVAGFFRRLLAFLVDLLLFVAAIHLVQRNLPHMVLSLGSAWTYLTGSIFFIYFVVLEGPFGGGRTVGKMLLGIVVTDYDGKAPTYPQAIMRRVIAIPLFFTAPLAETILGVDNSLHEYYIRILMTSIPFIAVALANFLVIPFNPFKQGIHDYFARTLIRPLDRERKYLSFEEMAGIAGNDWKKYHRQPQFSGAITFALVYIFFAYQAYPRESAEYLDLQRRLFPLQEIQGFQKARVFATPLEKNDFLKWTEGGEEYVAPPGQADFNVLSLLPADEDTTGTVTLIAQVSRADKWKYDPSAADYKAYTEQLMDEYYHEVLPVVFRDLHAGGYIRVEDWNNNNVRLVFLFVQAVRSAIPGSEVKTPIGSYSKTYEPLNVELRTPKVEEVSGS